MTPVNVYPPHPEAGDLDELLASLDSRDRRRRQAARRALVHLGSAAVPALEEALRSLDWRARWEAAKALGQVADPASSPALVAALEDSDFGVRWLAAEGLIAIGCEALSAVLQAMITHSDSPWFLGGAHHVLRSLADAGYHEAADPVLEALGEPAASVTLPRIAHDARVALPCG